MITLRELSPAKTFPFINQWRQDPEVSDGIGAPRRFIGLEADLRLVRRRFDRGVGSEVRCAVRLADSGELVGNGQTSPALTMCTALAEYNAMVGRRAAPGRGVGTAATQGQWSATV